MKMETVTQVKLVNEGKTQVAWIPTEAAVKGYSVELKEDGLFWNVTEVFNFTVDKKVIDENARNYKSHRKGTDI